MSMITVKFTEAELKLLVALASDQLFRREFIDPKMPGHRSNPEEVALGKALVSRLRAAAHPTPSGSATHAWNSSK